MFITDYASPPPGDYVLMEMPDVPSHGDDLAGMSEADLLVWYSQYARPRQDPGCAGFFWKNCRRVSRARVFSVCRTNGRMNLSCAKTTVCTGKRSYLWNIRSSRSVNSAASCVRIGARVQYSGPYWDEEHIEKHIEKNVRLYSDTGILLGPPPTCFIAVAYKLAERKSLNIEERRPSSAQESKLVITAMRDQKTGRMSDVVSRNMDMSEIIPYRIDEEKQLKVYLHDGIAKSLTNAVPRRGINIDGRQWSGHMIEPVAVESSVMVDIGTPDFKSTALFARNFLGLRPQDNAIIEPGPEYYPSRLHR